MMKWFEEGCYLQKLCSFDQLCSCPLPCSHNPLWSKFSIVGRQIWLCMRFTMWQSAKEDSCFCRVVSGFLRVLQMKKATKKTCFADGGTRSQYLLLLLLFFLIYLSINKKQVKIDNTFIQCRIETSADQNLCCSPTFVK